MIQGCSEGLRSYWHPLHSSPCRSFLIAIACRVQCAVSTLYGSPDFHRLIMHLHHPMLCTSALQQTLSTGFKCCYLQNRRWPQFWRDARLVFISQNQVRISSAPIIELTVECMWSYTLVTHGVRNLFEVMVQYITRCTSTRKRDRLQGLR